MTRFLRCLASLAGFDATTSESKVVYLSYYRGGKQLNQLNQLHNYTVNEVNMLHFSVASKDWSEE